jgi:hypothetical protein
MPTALLIGKMRSVVDPEVLDCLPEDAVAEDPSSRVPDGGGRSSSAMSRRQTACGYGGLLKVGCEEHASKELILRKKEPDGRWLRDVKEEIGEGDATHQGCRCSGTGGPAPRCLGIIYRALHLIRDNNHGGGYQ